MHAAIRRFIKSIANRAFDGRYGAGDQAYRQELVIKKRAGKNSPATGGASTSSSAADASKRISMAIGCAVSFGIRSAKRRSSSARFSRSLSD
jgi:hypothetical protein